MSLRMVKKLFFWRAVMTVLTLNIVCFLGLLLQQTFTWKIIKYSHSYMKTSPAPRNTQPTVNTTLNPIMLRKLGQIKEHLNISSLDKDAIFPPRVIGKYLLLYPNICRNVDKLDIIIVVHTAPPNLQKRQRIRDSFANASLFHPFQIRVAFLLGKTANQTLEQILWLEHVKYKDTVMGDFLDTYHNLTLKGIMGFRWISQYCSNSKLILKIDDDILINMYKLLYSYLNHMNGKKKSIFCNLWRNKSMPILREGKWKVDSHLYASQETFPYNYCSGFAVLLTSDLAEPMYKAAMATPFFWIDDIYLFGMLPFVVGGITYYNYALNKNMTLDDKFAINCTTSLGPRCPIFATVTTDRTYWLYWDMIKRIYSSSDWNVENIIVN